MRPVEDLDADMRAWLDQLIAAAPPALTATQEDVLRRVFRGRSNTTKTTDTSTASDAA